MATQNTSAPSESRQRYWFLVLRPLSWWLLLVLVLYGIRTHQRWMEQTRLNFTIMLAGQIPLFEAKSTFDGKPIFTGQNIPLGHHQFTVTHPKGDTYTTNLFIWYGAHDLGRIDLKRTMQTLTVTANPPAPVLSIQGPEFNVEFTNSPGMTSSVPTDQYVVTSRYAHWTHSDAVQVASAYPANWRIAPRLGAAQITCNESDATGQFMRLDGSIIEYVTFPYSISQLPEGIYKVSARHHDDVLSKMVNIESGTTNTFPIEFLYGSALLESEPQGATVRTVDGRYWGVTPLRLTELQPGSWAFSLQHNGYELATASLTVAVGQETTYQTNLISVSYTGDMKAAQQAMEAEHYDDALKAVGNALIAKPGDAAALTLQRNATGLGSLQRAKALGNQGDFMGGEKELATAIQVLPDNTEAPALLAEYKRREPEQVERMRVERLERPKKFFDSIISKISGASQFESHELTTGKPVGEVHSAILAQLKSVQPFFKISLSELQPSLQAFEIDASQEFSGGSRRCIIAGGQSKDDETQIYFTVLESKKVGFMQQPITSLLGTTPLEYTQIDPTQPQLSDKLKNQIVGGVTNLAARIQAAIGQPPAEQPAAPH